MSGGFTTVWGLHLSVGSPILLISGAVATIAIVGWMWFRLRGMQRNMRSSVIALRAITMAVVVLLIADFAVSYQTPTPVRVMVAVEPSGELSPDRLAALKAAKERVGAAFARHNISIFELAETDHAGEPSRAPMAALLLTDGGLTPRAADATVTNLQHATGAPVLVVTDLDETASPRAAVTDARISDRLYRGIPSTVTAGVRARGMAGRSSIVTVSDSAGVQTLSTINWTADDETRTVAIDVTPKVAGWQDYTVTVDDAANPTAFARRVSAWVEERQWRVLLFEGEPTAESGFIRRALDKSESITVDYIAQVSRDAATGNRPIDAGAGEGAQKPSAPAAAGSPLARLHAVLGDLARLNQYDCVIVGPTPSAMLSVAETARVRQWVDRRGGGLIVLGGNSFTGSVIASNGRLTAILPAAIDPASFASASSVQGLGHPVEASDGLLFSLVPTGIGLAGPLRGFAKTSDAASEKRDLLSAALKLGQIGPAGMVLAVAGNAQTSSSEAGRPLIAAQQLGAGRVVLFAPADSFKLKVSEPEATLPGQSPFESLWSGLTLWAAEGTGPASDLIVSNNSPAAGESVMVEARFRDAGFTAIQPAKIFAAWQAIDPATDGVTGPPRPLVFVPVADSDGVWRADLIAPEPGRYAIDCTATLGTGGQQKLTRRFTVVPYVPAAPGAARDALDRLVRESGGRVFALRELDQLIAELKRRPPEPATVMSTWRLRQFWPLAFLLPLLLAGEWLILRLKF